MKEDGKASSAVGAHHSATWSLRGLQPLHWATDWTDWRKSQWAVISRDHQTRFPRSNMRYALFPKIHRTWHTFF